MDQEVSPSTKQRKARRLGNRGTVAVMMAVCAPVILITVGLGIEASGWVVNQQGWMQRTADAAAIAGGLAYGTGVSSQTAVTEAAYVAEVNIPGATANTNGTRAWSAPTSTSPPTMSDNIVANNVIQVQQINGVRTSTDVAFSAQIQYTLPLFFSALAMHRYNASITLTATAIAENIPGQTGKYCVLALDGSTSTGASTSGIEFENGAAVDLSACGIQVNALGTDALYLTGGADLIANSVAVSGGYSISNGATMSVSGSTTTGAAPGVNPYANVPIPTPGTCASNNSFNTGQNIPAGTYCNGLTINYGTVTMGPGIIIVDGGNFHPTGGSTVNAANGTTIVLTGSSGSNVGTSQIDNGVTINLVAPTTGPTAGIAIIQDSRAGTTTSNMAGGASVNITGALVFPSSVVDFSNGSSNNSSCLQLVAFQVVFTGGANFGNNCAGTGTSGIGAQTITTLVR